jgi:hypothetical protein
MLCHPTSNIPTKENLLAQPGVSLSKHFNEHTQLEPPTPGSDPLAAGTETDYTNRGTTCTAPPLTQSTVSPKFQHQQFISTTDKTVTANASNTLLLPNPLTPSQATSNRVSS